MSDIVVCDECGQSVKKIHRRYKEHGYCSSCYARTFIKRECPNCSLFARLPKNDRNAICTKCETQKPCVRCKISGKPVGKITIYGVVCASCSPYFRPKQPCEICDQLSHRLTRVKRFGDSLRRCERCARADHRTCPNCHRYRKLIFINSQELCASCHSGELKPCKDCNTPIPIAYGQLCDNCYWKTQLSKRIVINQAMLSNQKLTIDLSNFAKWLAHHYGFKKASLDIAKYTLFFKKIEKNWLYFPTYSELIQTLGADYLRCHKKLLLWLEAEKILTIDESLKKRMTEEYYIKKMIHDVPNASKIKPLILEYEKFLRKRADEKRTSIQTIRYSLTAAIALMKLSQLENNESPNQATIKKYLSKSPGQKASLTLFINFLKIRYRLKIQIPRTINTAHIKKRNLEKKLIDLAKKYNSWGNQEYLHWYQYSLEFFHELKLPRKTIEIITIKTKNATEGIYIYYLKNKYFIPLPREHNQ